MKNRKLVLINPQIKGDPLFIDFLENFNDGCNSDQVIFEISLKQALELYEYLYYHEDFIDINGNVVEYLIERKKINDKTRRTKKDVR